MHPITLFLFATLVASAQTPRIQISHTTESLRGVSAVSRDIAWASGTHGTYLRTTDGGQTWTSAQVPDAKGLDFRAVVAFSADEAFLMSIGTGELSSIYHTSDAGRHWQLQLTNPNAKGFFDSMVFWDRTHGIVVGDPIPDETGKLKFEVFLTDDGQTWRAIPPPRLPPAVEGEGSFAASNTCIAIVPHELAKNDADIWFATGGKVARVFHSANRGQSWDVFDTPIVHGPDSAGIFSIAFRDALHGVIAGGDYKRPNDDGPNLAFTDDGGKTWKLSTIHPQAFFSAVTYDRKVNDIAIREQEEQSRRKKRIKTPIPPERLFIVGQDFIFDFRKSADPPRISAIKEKGVKFNAVSAYPEGGALVVGPNGVIASIP
jgi:photosystem II stability/assembly factor-like uncharacterized protein